MSLGLNDTLAHGLLQPGLSILDVNVPGLDHGGRALAVSISPQVSKIPGQPQILETRGDIYTFQRLIAIVLLIVSIDSSLKKNS